MCLIGGNDIHEDFDRIKYVISEIEGLNDKTIRLMTVLLSYDLNNYGDVTLRPNKELLKSFMQEYQCSCLPENIDFRKDTVTHGTGLDPVRATTLRARIADRRNRRVASDRDGRRCVLQRELQIHHASSCWSGHMLRSC